MHLVATTLIASLLLQTLALSGRSTIRGRVLDADGQPMPNVEMSAMMLGDRQLVGAVARTDDLGMFSIERVPAGRVLLRAQPRQPRRVTAGATLARTAGHPPAYFPGVLALDEAWPIEVGAEEIIELDFYMPPVLVASIKATVTGPDGYTLDHLRVIRPEANQIKNVRLDADGTGYVENLQAARYVVSARGRVKDQPLAAFEIVQVTPGEVPIDLALAPAALLTGRVVSDRGGVPAVDNLRVVAAWTDGAIDLDPLLRDEAAVAPDGSFSIAGLFGRRAIRVTGLADGWQVVSVRHGRFDVTTGTVDLAPGTTNEITITLARR